MAVVLWRDVHRYRYEDVGYPQRRWEIGEGSAREVEGEMLNITIHRQQRFNTHFSNTHLNFELSSGVSEGVPNGLVELKENRLSAS